MTAVEIREVVFVMDKFGYGKLVDRATYDRNQETIEGENPHVIPCLNTDKICLFTDTGLLHQVKASDIPYGKMRDKGTPDIHYQCFGPGGTPSAVCNKGSYGQTGSG